MGEVGEDLLLSVERSAPGRETDTWHDADTDSAQSPVEALLTPPLLCCGVQDSVPSWQPDFSEPSCFGSCLEKLWKESERDC